MQTEGSPVLGSMVSGEDSLLNHKRWTPAKKLHSHIGVSFRQSNERAWFSWHREKWHTETRELFLSKEWKTWLRWCLGQGRRWWKKFLTSEKSKSWIETLQFLFSSSPSLWQLLCLFSLLLSHPSVHCLYCLLSFNGKTKHNKTLSYTQFTFHWTVIGVFSTHIL